MQWRLCVLITESLCPSGNWKALAKTVVNAGADCIQLREKSLADRKLLARAKYLVAICRPRNVSVVINDRPDVALLAEADGVHLGQDDMSSSEARKIVGRQLRIGVSTSCLTQARAAVRDGADYCGIGPMFKSATKRQNMIVGTTYVKEYLRSFSHTPHLAIGGITADNVAQLLVAGIRGAAVSSAVCAAADPGTVVQQLVRALCLDGNAND